jgi:hypothetical protein
MCVAEFTNQVTWNTITIRTATPQTSHEMPTSRQYRAHADEEVPEQERLVEERDARVLGEIRRPAGDMGRVLGSRVPRKEPEHVRPQAAVAGRVRIAILITERMVLAVVGHPVERGALAGDAPEQAEQKPQRRGSLKAAVREEAMVAEADAETAGHPVEHQADGEPRPGEAEGRGERRHVNPADPEQDRPIKVAPVIATAFTPRLGPRGTRRAGRHGAAHGARAEPFRGRLNGRSASLWGALLERAIDDGSVGGDHAMKFLLAFRAPRISTGCPRTRLL